MTSDRDGIIPLLEDQLLVTPLAEEQLLVTKSDVITDRLSVTTSLEQRQVVIEEDVERGRLQIERVAVDRAVDEAPAPYQNGDTLIVSIVEERLVVEKRLFVVEELRITRTVSTEHVAIPATIRAMRAKVEHASTTSSTGRDTDG